MSLRKTARILCDDTSCPKFVDAVNAALARHHAREAGWLIRNKQDLCPQHRPTTRAARISSCRGPRHVAVEVLA